MIFKDKKHEEFYYKRIEEYRKSGGAVDCYSRPVIYLMGICQDTREHYKKVFDMKRHSIIIEGLSYGWQTGTTLKICRLAFNLWNGLAEEENIESEEYIVSKKYAVDNIFCCEYMKYFFEAVKLRYPEYIDN